jgi:hypothetical protein
MVSKADQTARSTLPMSQTQMRLKRYHRVLLSQQRISVNLLAMTIDGIRMNNLFGLMWRIRQPHQQ